MAGVRQMPGNVYGSGADPLFGIVLRMVGREHGLVVEHDDAQMAALPSE
jgi:hypothetical protein